MKRLKRKNVAVELTLIKHLKFDFQVVEPRSKKFIWPLRFVIPAVCVTNEREENVVKQHN